MLNTAHIRSAWVCLNSACIRNNNTININICLIVTSEKKPSNKMPIGKSEAFLCPFEQCPSYWLHSNMLSLAFIVVLCFQLTILFPFRMSLCICENDNQTQFLTNKWITYVKFSYRTCPVWRLVCHRSFSPRWNHRRGGKWSKVSSDRSGTPDTPPEHRDTGSRRHQTQRHGWPRSDLPPSIPPCKEHTKWLVDHFCQCTKERYKSLENRKQGHIPCGK